jgi:hypothetical protein
MKMTVFWVVAPYSLVKVYRRFRRVCCLHHQGDESNYICGHQVPVVDIIKTLFTSELSCMYVYIYILCVCV